jgi:hypothetical protein
MKAKSCKSIPTALFQYFDTEPITDPTELALLEKRLKSRRDTAQRLSTSNGRKTSRKPTVAEIIGLAGRLSVEDRLELLSELAAKMPSEKRRKLVQRIS